MDFGVVTFGATSGAEWREKVLRYEVAGFDFLFLPDHVGVFDPFSAAAAAAATTAHLRVGTLVLNVEFWNPLLLARAAVTTQLVADGRFVLGLGAGHARIEFEQAGLDYPPPAVRVRRLEAVARVVPRLVAGETIDDEELSLHGASLGLAPATVPLLVGGNGDGVLRVAARHADIVSLIGFTSGTELTATNLSHWSWEGLRNRIALIRGATRDTAMPEIHILVQFAAITNDPRDAVARWLGEDTSDGYLDSPFLLVGTQDQVRGQLAKLGELGVRCLTVFEESAGALLPLVRAR